MHKGMEGAMEQWSDVVIEGAMKRCRYVGIKGGEGGSDGAV